MSSLRTCAAVLVVAVSSVLVGCVAEGTVDEQEQSQTSATTFGAKVSAEDTTTDTGRISHGTGRAPSQTQAAFIDPNGNP